MGKLVIGGERYCLIPKGPCLIGSPETDPDAFEDEFPQHTVDFPYDYYCARFPVTNRLFTRFIEETEVVTLAEKIGWAYVFIPGVDEWQKIEGADWRHPTGPFSDIDLLLDHPVVSIGFYDAVAYIHWLNQVLGTELPDRYHFSLPSEVEWEKAARGSAGRRYPWGDEFKNLGCWYESGEEVGTMPVDVFSPAGNSPYGCADMSGNTWDWTTTVWGPDKQTQQFRYPYVANDGREDQTAGADYFRIIRGGSFKNNTDVLRCTCRDIDPVDFVLNNLGFRVFLVPGERF